MRLSPRPPHRWLFRIAGGALVFSGCTTTTVGSDASNASSAHTLAMEERPALPPGHQHLAREVGTQARTRLMARLKRLGSAPAFALGQEDALAYGVGWQRDEHRSDVQSVCGSHPAVLGWDAFGIELGAADNGDGVPFSLMRERIIAGHQMGAINTVSWHSHNPVTGGDAWDAVPTVGKLLPGGSHHATWRGYLDRLSEFLSDLTDVDGAPIPVILRPFHEHTGAWFWWGRGTTPERQFVEVWRWSIDYLRGERGLTNLLFAFSPNGPDIDTREQYLYGYPGDDYVDVFGIDYYFFRDGKHLATLAELAVDLASARGKVAAITEFGPRGGLNQFGIDQDGWFTAQFLAAMLDRPRSFGVAYALLWRNASAEHCFASYPGHQSETDFRALCDSPRVWLLGDLVGSPDPR